MGASASATSRSTIGVIINNWNALSGGDGVLQPKILILGCMGSGKSTLSRQLYRHSKSYASCLSYYTHTVQHNVLVIWKLLEEVCDAYNVNKRELVADFEVLAEFRHKELFTDKVVASILRLQKSGLLEECQMKQRYLPMPYNYLYFVQNTERILTYGFVPTEQDILYSYAPTIGLNEVTVRIGYGRYSILELPGHHIFRRKWTDFFKMTSVLIFMVDLSELADEEFYTGHLKGKTLSVYSELLANAAFRDAGIILLFNKADVLEEKSVGVDFTRLAHSVRSRQEAVSFYRSQFVPFLPKGRSYQHVVSLTRAVDLSSTVADSLSMILKQNKENAKPV